MLRLQVALAVAGGWTVYAARLTGQESAVALGSALSLAGAIVFTVNVARLFRLPTTTPAPPLPFPE